MYDFNLILNDTISVQPLDFPQAERIKLRVVEKDSILINNHYRTRLKIDSYSGSMVYDEYWIEGVGSTCGPFNPGLASLFIFDLFYPRLRCQNINDSLYFLNPVFSSCTVDCTTGSIVIKDTPKVLFFPNPATSNISITTPASSYTAQLLDATGRLVRQELFLQTGTHTLTLERLPVGVYYCRILKGDDLIVVEKVVKVD